MMPEMPWCPNDQRVRAEFLRDCGQLPGRVPAAGAHVHFKLIGIGNLIEFREEPALQGVGVPR